MVALGGGLMFKGLKSTEEDKTCSSGPSPQDQSDVLEELADLRRKVDRMGRKSVAHGLLVIAHI